MIIPSWLLGWGQIYLQNLQARMWKYVYQNVLGLMERNAIIVT